MKDSTKELLELIDTILNIILSIGAIVGFLLTYKSGFFHKLHSTVLHSHYHSQIHVI